MTGVDGKMGKGSKWEDEAFVASVYRRHHWFVWRSLRRLGTPDVSLDDAVQDVFVVVVRRMAEFRGAAAVQTWLFAIARRVAGAHRRRWLRHRRKVEAMAWAGSDHLTDPLERHDDLNLILRLLKTLSEDARTVYVLSELAGMNAEQIGRALGLNTTTVYSRRRAAKRELLAAVESYRRESSECEREAYRPSQ